ncbi:hypothetical protein B0H21DRAFT_739644 [Amylocystis lapponica]|nr:hypothetical protein B0H21DRAFT_739644 [Amylocystis lapponica]
MWISVLSNVFLLLYFARFVVGFERSTRQRRRRQGTKMGSYEADVGDKTEIKETEDQSEIVGGGRRRPERDHRRQERDDAWLLTL